MSSDSEVEFEIEEIIKDRVRHGKHEFFVKWAHFPSSENTWEPEHHLNRVLITQYRERKRANIKFTKNVCHAQFDESLKAISIGSAVFQNNELIFSVLVEDGTWRLISETELTQRNAELVSNFYENLIQ
jgi:hypothetical protein